MIAYLFGKVLKKTNNYIISNVSGVGYKVEMTTRNIEKLTLYQEVELWIYTFVREDAFRLIGFLTQEELQLFEQLLTVSGVGPKVALAILELDFSQIVNSINSKKIAELKISGVGKKTLEKVQIELLGKVENGNIGSNNLSIDNSQNEELVEALTSLGYKNSEITTMIKKKESQLTGELEKDVRIILKK